MYHVKIVIVIDWYSCFFFFFLWLEFSIWVWNFLKIFIYGASVSRFFFFFHNPTSSPGRFSLALLFTIVKNAKLKTGKLELWRKTKKSSSYLRSGFFFLGIAGNCAAIFIADTGSLSTDPTDPSGSGLVVALRARPRASRCFRKERTEKQDNVCVQGTSQRYVSCLK